MKTLSFKEPPAGHADWQKALTNNAAYSPLAMSKADKGADKPAGNTGTCVFPRVLLMGRAGKTMRGSTARAAD